MHRTGIATLATALAVLSAALANPASGAEPTELSTPDPNGSTLRSAFEPLDELEARQTAAIGVIPRTGTLPLEQLESLARNTNSSMERHC